MEPERGRAAGLLLRLRGGDDLGRDRADPRALPRPREIALTSPPAGLCARCRHARPLTSARGSTFWRCSLSDVDPHFPTYPRLPIVECSAFEPVLPPRNPV